MEPTTNLSPTAKSILDFLRARGGRVDGNDAGLAAWKRRTRHTAMWQLMAAGLVKRHRSLLDTRVWVYEAVAP